VIVKDMFPAPAAACAGVDPVRLLPTALSLQRSADRRKLLKVG
jgi:hypothetical protein